MKIAILTRHAIANYGSLLQAFATEQIFRDLGHDPITIDYVRTDERPENTTKLLLKKSKRWNKNALTKLVYYIVQQPDHVWMGRKFRKYQKEWLTLTSDCYSTAEELKEKPIEADLYCTGSDQVWGDIGDEIYDPVYFLSFLPGDAKKIAFAASLGYTTLPDSAIEFYRSALDSYHAITVRENSAVELFEKCTKIDIKQVLDPTLLYDSTQWNSKIQETSLRDYVLIYQLNANPEMDCYAQNFAKKTGKKLVRVSPEMHNIARNGKFVYLPSPGEFLSLIKNADYMITDSFHGTAFAINFNTQFIDVFPKNKSIRNRSILELTGLMDRVLTDFEDFSFIQKKIDFDKVNTIIEKERERSLEILKEMIN